MTEFGKKNKRRRTTLSCDTRLQPYPSSVFLSTSLMSSTDKPYVMPHVVATISCRRKPAFAMYKGTKQVHMVVRLCDTQNFSTIWGAGSTWVWVQKRKAISHGRVLSNTNNKSEGNFSHSIANWANCTNIAQFNVVVYRLVSIINENNGNVPHVSNLMRESRRNFFDFKCMHYLASSWCIATSTVTNCSIAMFGGSSVLGFFRSPRASSAVRTTDSMESDSENSHQPQVQPQVTGATDTPAYSFGVPGNPSDQAFDLGIGILFSTQGMLDGARREAFDSATQGVNEELNVHLDAAQQETTVQHKVEIYQAYADDYARWKGEEKTRMEPKVQATTQHYPLNKDDTSSPRSEASTLSLAKWYEGKVSLAEPTHDRRATNPTSKMQNEPDTGRTPRWTSQEEQRESEIIHHEMDLIEQLIDSNPILADFHERRRADLFACRDNYDSEVLREYRQELESALRTGKPPKSVWDQQSIHDDVEPNEVGLARIQQIVEQNPALWPMVDDTYGPVRDKSPHSSESSKDALSMPYESVPKGQSQCSGQESPCEARLPHEQLHAVMQAYTESIADWVPSHQQEAERIHCQDHDARSGTPPPTYTDTEAVQLLEE